jgi:hypothetical protein
VVVVLKLTFLLDLYLLFVCIFTLQPLQIYIYHFLGNMNKNYDIELSSNDSDNDSDSNETFTGADNSSKAKIKYMRFSPDALKYVSIGHKFSAKNPTKYTSKGISHNMCFKMIKSDSRLVKSILYSYGFTQCSRKNDKVNFIWANTHMNGQTLRTFLPWQRINHFPRSVSITKKDMLHQNLSLMKKHFGGCYDFVSLQFSFLFV